MTNEMFQDLDVKNSINARTIGADLLAVIKQAVFDMEHPVGDIEEQRPGEPTPAEKYGMGTWTLDTLHEGRAEIGASDAYPLGSTGGEATHTLTYTELPDLTIYIGKYGPSGSKSSMVSDLQRNVTPADTLQIAEQQGMVVGRPHNNMQPYLVVNYWKRIA